MLTGCETISQGITDTLKAANEGLRNLNAKLAQITGQKTATKDQVEEATCKGQTVVLDNKQQQQAEEDNTYIAVVVENTNTPDSDSTVVVENQSVDTNAQTEGVSQANTSVTVASSSSTSAGSKSVILLDPKTRQPVSNDVIILEPKGNDSFKNGETIDLGEKKIILVE
jgi:hypothetical protein